MLDVLRFDIPGGLKFKQIARRFRACASKRVQRGLLVKMLLAETLDVHCNVKDFWELDPSSTASSCGATARTTFAARCSSRTRPSPLGTHAPTAR